MIRHAIFALCPLLASTLYAQIEDEQVTEMLNARYANGITAIVEDKIITAEDVRRQITPYLSQIQSESQGDPIKFGQMLDEAEDQVIQTLTDNVLIVKQFFEDKGAIPAVTFATRLTNESSLNSTIAARNSSPI